MVGFVGGRHDKAQDWDLVSYILTPDSPKYIQCFFFLSSPWP